MTRRKTNSTLTFIILAVILVGGIIYVGARMRAGNPQPVEGDPGLSRRLMTVVSDNGQPSSLIEYEGFTVSFNPELHIPNWVSWELTGKETLGQEPRYNRFMQDEATAGCPEPGDYSYSGYDRGHMAPAGDMKWSKSAMRETFYLTNICPQAKSLNTGSWKKLEEKCRIWAQTDSAIYIVCGPVLADEPREYIGKTRVAVPQRFFKVIASPYANPPRGIGFIMPNENVEGGMQKCAVTIDEVEALTGLDFFSQLPRDVETAIESQKNFNLWSNLGR